MGPVETVRIRYARVTVVLVALVPSVISVGAARAQYDFETLLSPDRIVHRFDFDEQTAGNLEEIPKYWEPLRPEGFPHFARGAFDFEVGRTAPPSFHLACEGRNVAFQYTGPDTRVRSETDYRIDGYIHPDNLVHARACVSAHYLDKSGGFIPGTLVRSPYLGGTEGPEGWQPFELHLAAAPEEAYTISLTAWVLQQSQWRVTVPRRRHIPRRDVRAGAWFDDITIFALPRAQIATNVPGNVLDEDDAQELQIILIDADDPRIEGRLTITAADGGLVETHVLPVSVAQLAETVRIPIGHLSPGVYKALLDVFASGTHILSRSVTFARLAPTYRRTGPVARSFGVVVSPGDRSDPAAELRLLERQKVGTVKLPVWTGLPDESPSITERRATDRLLQSLVKRGFVLAGVFVGPPGAIVRGDGAYVRPLTALLAGDPAAWHEHLAAVVAPYASTFRWWQIGSDGGLPSESEKDLRHAVSQLREAMRPFISLPRLSLPVAAALYPTPRKLPVEQVTAMIGSEVRLEHFADQVGRLKALGFEQVSLHIEPLPADRYRRLPQLIDWAQRTITARHTGAATVFVPQTWRVRETPQGDVTEPLETFVVLRTIADLLADTLPGSRVRVADGVHCLAFDDGPTSVLAMWDPNAPPEGRRLPFQLGRADRQIDMWGVAKPFERDELGRQIIELGATPIFVPGVDRWLIDFRTSITLKPDHVESGEESVAHSVEINYRGDQPLAGEMNLQVPDTWGVSPREFTFSLSPQRVTNHRVEIRYPHSEPAGEKQIRALVNLSRDSLYLEVPLTVDFDVSDLDVWGMAVVEGKDLILKHVVTNRSTSVLNFRASASVPGRERQYRPISNLLPGGTQTVEYRFNRGPELIGRAAQLVLREVNDGPRIHNLETIVP